MKSKKVILFITALLASPAVLICSSGNDARDEVVSAADVLQKTPASLDDFDCIMMGDVQGALKCQWDQNLKQLKTTSEGLSAKLALITRMRESMNGLQLSEGDKLSFNDICTRIYALRGTIDEIGTMCTAKTNDLGAPE